jgi:hypothetical protein
MTSFFKDLVIFTRNDFVDEDDEIMFTPLKIKNHTFWRNKN